MTSSADDAPRTPSDLLDRALASDSARPLITFYDDASGERTELSVATFANWVAKTANLLRDDLDVQPGARVVVALPVHWQAAVWLQAAWALGLVVDLVAGASADLGSADRAPTSPAPADLAPADLAVVTHDVADVRADLVVSCGLGAMGLARAGRVPAYAGALDYDREVHGHGDRFVPAVRPTPDEPALVVAGATVTAGALTAAAAAGRALPHGGRVLVSVPFTSRESVLAGVLVPLATGVTAVLCRHLDPDRLPARTEQENLAAALGEPRGALPRWTPGSAR